MGRGGRDHSADKDPWADACHAALGEATCYAQGGGFWAQAQQVLRQTFYCC